MGILEVTAPVLGWLWKLLGLLHDVVATVHIGTLVEPESQRGSYYFLTVTNRSPKRSAVITHVSFIANGTEIPVINPNIKLPAELKPEQVWHTHLRLDALLPKYQRDGETCFVVCLSSGKQVRSKKRENVPEAGIFTNPQ